MQRTYPGAPAGDGVEGVAGLERAEGVADLLRHALDAVAVVDKGVAAGLVEEREQVRVRRATDGDDGVDVSEAGELDGEEAEGEEDAPEHDEVAERERPHRPYAFTSLRDTTMAPMSAASSTSEAISKGSAYCRRNAFPIP